mmetsp:Transcript_3835/g.13645  ORF Transcript_3835/g.13645 Transcript_3835/m.13645 type:complete len:214 (+) Transcript_3835:164-805(+)
MRHAAMAISWTGQARLAIRLSTPRRHEVRSRPLSNGGVAAGAPTPLRAGVFRGILGMQPHLGGDVLPLPAAVVVTVILAALEDLERRIARNPETLRQLLLLGGVYLGDGNVGEQAFLRLLRKVSRSLLILRGQRLAMAAPWRVELHQCPSALADLLVEVVVCEDEHVRCLLLLGIGAARPKCQQQQRGKEQQGARSASAPERRHQSDSRNDGY